MLVHRGLARSLHRDLVDGVHASCFGRGMQVRNSVMQLLLLRSFGVLERTILELLLVLLELLDQCLG
jgi:hypothetical protein